MEWGRYGPDSCITSSIKTTNLCLGSPEGRCTHQLAAVCAPKHTVATPTNEQLGPRGRGPCLRWHGRR